MSSTHDLRSFSTWRQHLFFFRHLLSSKANNHEEGDHHSDVCELGEIPNQSHESGSYGYRGGVGDAGRRRQESAAGDRRRRGLQQADQEPQEEGGRRGDRGAEDARYVRRVVAPAPGGDQGSSGAGAVAVQRLAALPVRRGARPVRSPPPPVAAGRARRLRLRQQLLARGGAQPPGQLLAAGREARLLPHGALLLLVRRRRQHQLQLGASPR
uniref:Uncharacterized protein n=1 Tax=Triticum urartu TaxID=4572 RepID=A0A8R7UXJ2_TRIUA